MSKNTVRLRTGAEVDSGVLVATRMNLDELLDTGTAMVFHEAVMIARNSQHRPRSNNFAILKEMQLLDSTGQMHESIRDCILALTEGEGMEMGMVNPLSPKRVP